MFYNKQVELWQKGERVHIGGGVFKDGIATLLKTMNVDIQPYSKAEAQKDYGLTVECSKIMYCDLEDIRIDKTFIKHEFDSYEIVSIKDWDDYCEVILNRVKVESNFDKAKTSINKNIESALNEIGAFVTAESQVRTPVDSGRLRREQSYKTYEDHVKIGTNVEYAKFVHNSTSKSKGQSFLSDAVMQNIARIVAIAKKHNSKV